MLLESSEFLETARMDENVNKEELVKSMENRISLMISKAVMAPMGGNFSVFEEGDTP